MLQQSSISIIRPILVGVFFGFFLRQVFDPPIRHLLILKLSLGAFSLAALVAWAMLEYKDLVRMRRETEEIIKSIATRRHGDS